MDSKYGRVFTQDDVVGFVGFLLEHALVDAPERAIEEFESTIPKDEPVFLLRGQDRYAIDAIDEYLFQVGSDEGVNPEFVDKVRDAKGEFERFAVDNQDRMKTPD